MNASKATMVICAAIGLLAGPTLALNIPTVYVGDPGNAGEWSGESYDGYGTDRLCGSVAYIYYIGKYEVTAGQYTEFLNAVAAVDTYGLYNPAMWSDAAGCKIERYAGNGTPGSPYQYRVASEYADRPVNYVSWGDAARFANWLHNGQPSGTQNLSTTEDGAYYLNGATSNTALAAVIRKADWTWAITSEDEWYKAAYYQGGSTHAGYWDYPTTSNAVPGRDLNDASGNNANYYPDSGPYPIDSPYYTTVVGEFQNSKSPYGTFDQGGNVWEWNEAVLLNGKRGIRGGSFYNYSIGLYASYRNSYYPASEIFNVGFRVSRIPEPCSVLLLLVGGAALVTRKCGVASHESVAFS